MKLVYLGKELNTSIEHELFSDNEFGFNITVTYKTDSWMSLHEGKQVIDKFNNCTEVHHLYQSVLKEEKIAFESDIHSTGCTRSVEDIESVDIQLAYGLEAEY